MVAAFQNPDSSSSAAQHHDGLPVILQFTAETGATFQLPGYDRITIGRKMRENHTKLDLARHDGATLGVSRRHAEITPDQGKLFIRDLHSVTGTWLNGEKLRDGVPYPLSHGDSLQLGQMRFRIQFSRSVVQTG